MGGRRGVKRCEPAVDSLPPPPLLAHLSTFLSLVCSHTHTHTPLVHLPNHTHTLSQHNPLPPTTLSSLSNPTSIHPLQADLELEVSARAGGSVEGALRALFADEQLDQDNQYKCEKCRQEVRA